MATSSETDRDARVLDEWVHIGRPYRLRENDYGYMVIESLHPGGWRVASDPVTRAAGARIKQLKEALRGEE